MAKPAPSRSRLGKAFILLSRARQQAVFSDFFHGLLDRDSSGSLRAFHHQQLRKSPTNPKVLRAGGQLQQKPPVVLTAASAQVASQVGLSPITVRRRARRIIDALAAAHLGLQAAA